jgi:hypothetical protein
MTSHRYFSSSFSSFYKTPRSTLRSKPVFVMATEWMTTITRIASIGADHSAKKGERHEQNKKNLTKLDSKPTANLPSTLGKKRFLFTQNQIVQ